METVTQYTHWCQNKVSKLPILSISSQLHLGLHCTLNPTFSGREFYTLGFRFLQLSKHAQGLNKSSSVLMLMLNIFLQTGGNSYAFLIFSYPSYSPGSIRSDHEGWWFDCFLHEANLLKGRREDLLLQTSGCLQWEKWLWMSGKDGIYSPNYIWIHAFWGKTDIFHWSFKLVGIASAKSCPWDQT